MKMIKIFMKDIVMWKMTLYQDLNLNKKEEI